MNKRFVLVWCFLSLSLLSVNGADKLVVFPKEAAAWTIKVSPSPDSEFVSRNSAFLTLKQVDVEQDGRKFRHVANFKNGKSKESWGLVGMRQIVTEDSNGTVFFSSDRLAFDRQVFHWLKPQYLQDAEPIDFKQRSCYHYKAKLMVGDDLGTIKAPVIYQAWIDAETLLPVAFDNGVARGIYEFQETPPSKLDVPEKFRIPLNNRLRVMGRK